MDIQNICQPIREGEQLPSYETTYPENYNLMMSFMGPERVAAEPMDTKSSPPSPLPDSQHALVSCPFEMLCIKYYMSPHCSCTMFYGTGSSKIQNQF